MQYQWGMLRGYVRVNDELQTSVSNIWAAGDLIGEQTDSQPATSVGAHDGVIAGERAFGQVPKGKSSRCPAHRLH
jgi:pyruvate/2-oxoglutarate dehydrogenase complex dihydrolipoamide dehydrogenase (E3) component